MTQRIELTRDELSHAATGGALREIDALLRGRVNHFEPPFPWQEHIIGAMGEMAVAKVLNRFWFPCYDSPHGIPNDVGKSQVRTVRDPSHSLIVRDADSEKLHQPFILVHAEVPAFTILGWASGHQVKERGRYEPASNGKPQAWFLRAAKLNSWASARTP